ncbi:acyl carrier protein [Pinibacter soli]|uniref:Acyl carrier protein n=1 Tax=Pinibacter soli TaxID=3044211 RepID=A0ABT6R8A7_9BACT|nr:acyl carrier protein [Pinibacter soli]MDI3318636.1 acyl carrier protein [Pinibacter soli]
MELQKFVQDFEAEFEEVTAGSIKPETELESIDEWGSLQALVIISMLDSKYNVNVSGAELYGAKTVNDIFKLIQAKKTT